MKFLVRLYYRLFFANGNELVAMIDLRDRLGKTYQDLLDRQAKLYYEMESLKLAKKITDKHIADAKLKLEYWQKQVELIDISKRS